MNDGGGMSDGIVVAALVVLVIVAVAGWVVAALLAYRGPMVIYVPKGARLVGTPRSAEAVSHVQRQVSHGQRGAPRDDGPSPPPPIARPHPSFPRGPAGRAAVENFALRRVEERQRLEEARRRREAEERQQREEEEQSRRDGIPLGDELGEEPVTVQVARDGSVDPAAETPVGAGRRVRSAPPPAASDDLDSLLEGV